MKTNTPLLRRLLLLLTGFALLMIVRSGWALNWQIETVDDDGFVGAYTSLALDGNGRPHISYREGGNFNLKYARWDGAAWQIETVDNDGVVGWFTSLALDGNDRPHISYFDFDNHSLKYARWDGAAWQIETVDDDDGDIGRDTSLALDGDDRPHISYFDFTNTNLKYARWDGVTWQIETVDDDGDVGYENSLALDGDGRPHISYYDRLNSKLKYARWDGAAWQIETVDDDGSVGEFTSLALDGDGRPHISYYDSTNNNLKYARWDGAAWQIETVDNDDGDVGSRPSLALDGDDRPHIGYFDLDNGNLKYARWDGAAWQIETVDDDGHVGLYPSLALDGDDRPHISYYDSSISNLKYATEEQPATVAVTAAGPGITANGVAFGKEDILEIGELGSGDWEILFDGSDAGLTAKHDLNAIHVNAADDIYLSFFQNKIKTADLGPVHGQDILHYDGSSFSFFLDGSDVGLTTTAEKIDALHILDDGTGLPGGGSCGAYLLISTLGTGKVPAAGGGQLKFQGEDILGFCMTNSGAETAGFWHMVLDGSAEGMPKNSTDSISAAADGQTIYLTTQGAFNVGGASGSHSEVYQYDTTTNEFSGPLFSAPADGLSQKVDGLHLEGELP